MNVFQSCHLGEVCGEVQRREKKKMFKKLDSIETVVSIDKIENLRERNRQLLVFKYTESYGSQIHEQRKESDNQWNRKAEL